MSDKEKPAEGGAAPKKGGFRSVLLLLVISLICGGGGFALPLFMPHLFFEAPPQPAATVAAEEPKHEQVPAFIDFGETVVNMNSERFTRYLKVSIILQVDKLHKEVLMEQVKHHSAILKSWLLSFLADQSLDQIRGAAGQNRLRREILDHFNATLSTDGTDLIDDVLFEEFGVQ